MKHALLLTAVLIVAGCKPPNGGPATQPTVNTQTLAEARKNFTTKLAKQVKAKRAAITPPAKSGFTKVQYESPAGSLVSYLTADPKDGKKRPAIIWVTGGDCNTIDGVWGAPNPKDDQSASQYRSAGIVMMFPSLRGGNDNASFKEHFYGEVDDVLAAADYLAKLDYVDPTRIYLGGHSTGGTMALLVSEYAPRFRAVFSFGPVDNIRDYPHQYISAVNYTDQKEVELRSPGKWLHSIQNPTFVFEGGSDGNLQALETMAKACTNPKGHFYAVRGADHFTVLAPMNALIAQKILKDTGDECDINFTDEELRQATGK